MASRNSTPQSRSRSSTSSDSSDTTMHDAPPLAPARPRQASHSNPSSTTTTQTASNDPAFSLLLSLPRELRDRIYTFALTSPYPFWWPAPSTPKHHVALGLLTSSRQVYEEAAPILYSTNKFLFTHPSDCNIFRVVASPYSEHITSVYFRIREKDLRLWTTYLGSKLPERSLKADLPRLKSLWVFMRCGSMGTPAMIGQLGGQGLPNLPPALAAQVQAVQNALGQQVQALQQQVHNLTQAMTTAAQGNSQAQATPQQTTAPAQFPGAQNGASADGGGNANQIPPPPPPPPAMPFIQFAQGAFQPHQHHHPHPPPPQPHAHGTQNNPPPNPSPLAQHMVHSQQASQPQQQPQVQVIQPHQPHPHTHHQHQHTFYASFLRWEREMGLENLCLSLQETRPIDTDVKIVCIMRVPKPEVTRLVRLYPEELAVDKNGDARTRFRKLHGVEVSLEVSGYEVPAS